MYRANRANTTALPNLGESRSTPIVLPQIITDVREDLLL